jgi:acid phosphatase family membrane protein YuiD
VKKIRTPQQIEAAGAGRKRALFVAAIALAAGLIMLLLTNNFVQLHCMMLIAVALSGGIAAGRAAYLSDPPSARSAGVTGGIYAALAFALPFIIYNFYLLFSINDATVAARTAQLTPAELANIQQFNVLVDAEYFRRQDTAIIFGYFFFALLFGWIVGMIGGAIAKRQMAQ